MPKFLSLRPARPSSGRESESGRAEDSSRRPALARPLPIVALGAWFGLLTGLAELGLLMGQHTLNESTMLGSLQMNRHYHWMVPLSQLFLALIITLPMVVLAAWLPTRARRAAIFVNLALGTFSLLKMITGFYTGAAVVLALGAAWQLTRWLDPRSAGLSRLVKSSLPLLVGVVGLLGASSYDRFVLAERRAIASLPATAPGSPNVLLIVLDTVRADHLSVYGYHRETTPNLAKLARRGVAFEQARSAAPWTLPSHSTIFTGRWPRELGVAAGRTLDAKYPTLAQALTAKGYVTAGFVGNTYFCNSWYGLARGFAHYEDFYEQNVLISPDEALRCTAVGRWLIKLTGTAYNVRPGVSSNMKDAERVNRDFLKWQADHPGRPFFAFLNYIEAHDPYTVPPGFDRHFGLKPETAADAELIRHWHSVDKAGVTPRQLTMVRDAYDDCLSTLDEQLGRVFEELCRRGILDKTLVILTADHGEQLGERGLYGHGQSLFHQEVHVPLILAGPGIPSSGQFIPEPVSLRDIPATVVERLGTAESHPFPGRTLARFWGADPGGASAADAMIYSETAIRPRNASKQRPGVPPALSGPVDSLVSDGLLYIRGPFWREQVFDLAGDPDEAHDLAGTPKVLPIQERCRAQLDRLAASAPLRR